MHNSNSYNSNHRIIRTTVPDFFSFPHSKKTSKNSKFRITRTFFSFPQLFELCKDYCSSTFIQWRLHTCILGIHVELSAPADEGLLQPQSLTHHLTGVRVRCTEQMGDPRFRGCLGNSIHGNMALQTIAAGFTST